MNIRKQPNETQEQFIARGFRWNRICGEAFAARQARYACNCNQGRLPCSCIPRPFIDLKSMARPMTRDELRACGTHLAFGPTHRISRVRACWYGAGLVFGVTLIAMAVFGIAG